MFRDSLYAVAPEYDEEGRCRADGAELRPEVQREVEELWPQVTDDNLNELSDFAGYKSEFLRLFGFGVEGVDYEADVSPNVPISGLL